jgi:hypothetical protein
MFFLVLIVQIVSWLPWQLFELTDVIFWDVSWVVNTCENSRGGLA